MLRARRERAQGGQVTLAQIGRNDGVGQAPADRLVRRPAEQSRRLPVPFDDAVVGVDGDIRIQRVLQHLRCLTLPLRQREVGADPLLQPLPAQRESLRQPGQQQRRRHAAEHDPGNRAARHRQGRCRRRHAQRPFVTRQRQMPHIGQGVWRHAAAASIEQRVGARRIAVEHFHERAAGGGRERRAEEILGPECAVHEPAQGLAPLGGSFGQGRRGIDRQEEQEPGGAQPASQVLDQNDLGRQRHRAAIPGALHRSSPARLAHHVVAERQAVAGVERLQECDCKLLARADAPGEPDAMQTPG